MTVDVTIEISSDEVLDQIVTSVFQTMMGLDVRRIEDLASALGPRFAATIRLDGSWAGAVIFEAHEPDACRLAGAFLSMPPPDAVDDDVKDVLGEIANMIGGNLKSILPPGVKLSLPSVTCESDELIASPQKRTVERYSYAYDAGAFWLTRVTSHVPNASPSNTN